MTSSVDTSHPLSPASSVTVQQAQEQSVHGGRNGGYAWTKQHGLPFTKDDLAKATAECLIFQEQRPTPAFHSPGGKFHQGRSSILFV